MGDLSDFATMRSKYIDLVMVIFMLSFPIAGSVVFFDYAVNRVISYEGADLLLLIVVLLVWTAVFSLVYYGFRRLGLVMLTKDNLKDFIGSDKKLKVFFIIFKGVLPAVFFVLLPGKGSLISLPIVYLYQYLLDIKVKRDLKGS